MIICGQHYDDFDLSKDQVLKHGLIDPYLITPEREKWLVIDTYVIWSARLQKAIIIPRWFISDLSSIPRVARLLIPVNGHARRAALPHDLGYALKPQGVSRHQWDLVYRDFCKMDGVGFFNRNAQYAALVIGGWSGWKVSRMKFAPLLHRLEYQKRYSLFGLYTSIPDHGVFQASAG